jgi:hypothetical protein
MAKSTIKRKRAPKSVLKLPDLEQSKSAVLNSLTSPSSQRTYDHAIREFIDWYCSEPRLAFNKTAAEASCCWEAGSFDEQGVADTLMKSRWVENDDCSMAVSYQMKSLLTSCSQKDSKVRVNYSDW